MKKLTVFMVIFMLFLTGSLLYIGYYIQGKNKSYAAFENDLIDVARTYVSTNQIDLQVGGSYELTMDQMFKDNLLHTNKVEDDECNGNVTVKRGLNGYEYKPYIKCSKYESIRD